MVILVFKVGKRTGACEGSDRVTYVGLMMKNKVKTSIISKLIEYLGASA